MATDRPDWVPEGWAWFPARSGGHASRVAANGQMFTLAGVFPYWQIAFIMPNRYPDVFPCIHIETAVKIAELLAAERGGWA